MKLLVVNPGASYSTADVDAGVRYGLQRQAVDVSRYRLTERIERSQRWLYATWRRARRTQPTITKPTIADVFYLAGVGCIERALRLDVDAVLVISAMFLHPDVVILLRRARLPVFALFTETPYDLPQELKIAALVSGCWTNERSSVDAFRHVNPCSGYLPHAWHPDRHTPGLHDGDETVPAHDVVFVGSGFPERVAWLSAIDWDGIDLGLYGHWQLKANHPLRKFVRPGVVDNRVTAALYRRARVGLNLYREAHGAQSLNPRAYELAACGVPYVSQPRSESRELFGDVVPLVQTPADASYIIRSLLNDPIRRARIAAELPALVARHSWADRIHLLLNDISGAIAAGQAA